MNDPYRRIAGIYDRLFDRMNQGLRLAGMRMFRPAQGMNVLDVGCGTGSHLELYQRFGCNVFGVDLSPAMLTVARSRLGGSARLCLADGTRVPYADHCFDLIIAMLTLHEMPRAMRDEVVTEMQRVLKDGGRILMIDFHTGPYVPLHGWMSKAIIFISEQAAGREHYKNYREFMATKGLTSLAAAHRLEIEKQRVLAGGTFAAYLCAA